MTTSLTSLALSEQQEACTTEQGQRSCYICMFASPPAILPPTMPTCLTDCLAPQTLHANLPVFLTCCTCTNSVQSSASVAGALPSVERHHLEGFTLEALHCMTLWHGPALQALGELHTLCSKDLISAFTASFKRLKQSRKKVFVLSLPFYYSSGRWSLPDGASA